MEMSVSKHRALCDFYATSVLTAKNCYFFAPLNVEFNPALA